MADPTKFTPGYSYYGWQSANPTRPLPAPEVDNDFANAALSINETIDALKDIRRSDGRLKNGVVTADSLAPSLTIGLETPTAWATATRYAILDTVFVDDNPIQGIYRAVVSHDSTVFTDDLAAGYWELIFDLSQAGLSAVAQSGQYADLLNKPVLGSAAATDSSDYATAAQKVPAGGTTGQVLAKASDTDNDVEWTPAGVGDMLAVNDLSDVASQQTSLYNLKGATFAADRTAMKALASSTAVPVILTEQGREGQFVFRTGDFTAQAAADPLEGVIAKANDTPISTGALFRLYQGAVSVKWFGAKGDGVTDDRVACQAAVDWVRAQGGGKVLFPDGTYLLVGIASPDSMKNGINIPFFGSFEPGRPIILQGEGKATLVAGSDDMIVIRCSTPEAHIRDLRIDGGNAMWTGFTNTWGIAFTAQDRTASDVQISVTDARVLDCVIEKCAEGIYYEVGPSVPAGSGAFYNVFERNTLNFNTRHMWFGPGAFAPDNRPTRSLLTGNRFTRGAIGLDLEFVTEFTLIANNFEMFEGPDRPLGPRGFRTAIYVGEFSANNTLYGGYAEDCDNALYYHASARPTGLVTRDFPPHSVGINTGATFAGMQTAGKIRLVRETDANQPFRIDFAHAGFASIVADSAGDGTRDLVVRTNNADRQRWNPTGGTTIYGSEGDISVSSNGRTISSSSASGLSLSATGGGPVSLSKGGTAIVVYDTEMRPQSGVSNLGIDATNTTGRWNSIYLQNAPNVASDIHYKELDPDGWSDAELRVAQRLSGLIRAYSIKDEFRAEGEAARRKAGVIAQEVVAAFADEGLDAHAYGMVTKGEFYGVVYEELLAFALAGQDVRVSRVEARLAALEA